MDLLGLWQPLPCAGRSWCLLDRWVAWSARVGRYEAIVSIPNLALLIGTQLFELQHRQTDTKRGHCYSSVLPIGYAQRPVHLESVQVAHRANAIDFDLGNHGMLQAKRKAVTSKGRPILRASSSVVAAEHITGVDGSAQ